MVWLTYIWLWAGIPIQEAITQEGSGEAINQLYMTTMRKYEAIKDEYDSIRKRYSDLVASHSNNISKLELTQVCLWSCFEFSFKFSELVRMCFLFNAILLYMVVLKCFYFVYDILFQVLITLAYWFTLVLTFLLFMWFFILFKGSYCHGSVCTKIASIPNKIEILVNIILFMN